jgi:hypothetical protein
MGGPLVEGKLEEYIVHPWHGSRFDIRSGEVVSPPAMRPETTYEVEVENNNILIKRRKDPIDHHDNYIFFKWLSQPQLRELLGLPKQGKVN